MTYRICIFASGQGSNARNIHSYFQHKENIEISIILSNNKHAGVLNLAKEEGIDYQVIDKQIFQDKEFMLNILNEKEIDLMVLAGFLWLIPPFLISEYPNRIINIHPALLPKYGGKGMYGMNVHNAVKHNKERESGITIHYVDEKYDEGSIIFQAKCSISPTDSPEDIAHKVHELEYKYFPSIIEFILMELIS